jgi:hypothetical protein
MNETKLKKSGCKFVVKNNYNEMEVSSETLDKKDFRSVMLDLGFWCICDTDKPKRTINKLIGDIKSTIISKGSKYHFSKRIIDLGNTPFNFNETKLGYVSLEYTIFLNKNIKFDKKEMTMVLNDLVDVIYKEHFVEPVGIETYKNRIKLRTRNNYEA